MATILLVEDDNNLREIYEARLKAEGYDIASAHDGEEALVVAKEKKPNLIIADVMMPKISGLEMLDILKNTAGMQDVKIIMLTALGQAEDQQKASKLGADRYLVKSQVTLEDIVNAAHDLLENPNAASPAPAAEPAVSTVPAPTDQPPAAAIAATPPVAPEPPQATPVVAEPPAPSPAPTTTTTNAAVDDKLISDAVTSFGDNGDTKEDKPDGDPAAPAPTMTDSSLPTTTPTESADMSSAEASVNTADPINPPSAVTTDSAAVPATDSSSTASTAPTATNNSPLDVSKDLKTQLEEESKEVESATSGQGMDEASSIDPKPIAPPTPPTAADGSDEPHEDSESSTMKVIKPLPSEDKKDINALLEQEELKDTANATGTIQTSGSTNPDQVQVFTPSGSDGQSQTASTANDIAL